MTWPWVRHLRDAVFDPGDSFLNAWILWWNYHQTFNDPLNLFHANIFYPYQYTLAFSENNYGISLALFPLYALGLRPLTVHGVATLLGFAFSGYGAFRLTRTLTNSTGAALIGSVAFAFVPFRFHHLPHITYLSAGWIPLLLEALVLFVRRPDRKYALWLGVTFFMNGLSCIHWFVLTLLPLGMTAIFLMWSRSRVADWTIWSRGAAAVGLALIALLPFFIPYLRVSELYGLIRGREETAAYSAELIHWLTVDWQNKLWSGLGTQIGGYQTELALFPGLMPLICAAAAFLFVGARLKTFSQARGDALWRKGLVIVLDLLAVGAACVVLVTALYGRWELSGFDWVFIRVSDPTRALGLVALALIVRFLFASWASLSRGRKKLLAMLPSNEKFEAVMIAGIWAVLGFLGSFGLNFILHRFLFDTIPLFKSIRVPARWAMICYLGLAVLAALGVRYFVEFLRVRYPKWRWSALYPLIVVLFLFEQRAAPLRLIHGPVDPDALTLALRDTPMRGGIVELPAGEGFSNYHYVLRAADHARPLVTAVSGFSPPIERAIESMTRSEPIPDLFLDLLEAIPVSYLVIHNSALNDDGRKAMLAFLDRGESAGRIRLVRRYGEGSDTDDLYVVTKTEPEH